MMYANDAKGGLHLFHFTNFCASHIIRMHLIAPYSPKKNKIIIYKVKTMMKTKALPLELRESP